MRKNILVILLIISNSIYCQIPMDSLQGYWPFNGNANEFFNNKNNGIIHGPILSSDRCGNQTCAFEFDGIDDYIECTTDSMNIVDEVSISLWFNKSSLGEGADIAVSKFSIFSFDSGYNIQFESNGAPEIRGRDRNNSFKESNTDNISRLDNNWHHVVGIVDRSVWKVYVDTILIGSFNSGHSMVNIGGSSNNLTFGRRSSQSTTLPWNYFKGQIDDILIYNRAIEHDEIKALYEFSCNATKQTAINHNGCVNDGYEVIVNGTLYNEQNQKGKECISLGTCSDSIIMINLTFNNYLQENIEYSGCRGDGYEVVVNSVTYNENNPTGQQILTSEFGCDSIVMINLTFNNDLQESIEYSGCIGDGYEVVVNSVTYNENNPTGQQTLTSQFGCDSIVMINLTFNNDLQENIEYLGCRGDGYEVVVNSVTYNENNPTGQQILTSQFGCDSLLNIDLKFNDAFVTELDYTISDSNPKIEIQGKIYEKETTDSLYFTSIDGCDSVLIINILSELESECKIYIPNIISSSIGLNSSFKLYYRSSCNVQILEFSIYDRWGNKIVDESNNVEWNGECGYKKCEKGVYTYYYKLLLYGKVHEYVGSLTLM